MISKRITIQNPVGIHARPAYMIAEEARKFISEIHIKHNQDIENAKSSIGLISLCVATGQDIDLLCNGPDEADAMEQLTKVFCHINKI